MATETKLAGKKISKDSLVFEVLGVLDELSAAVGLAKVKADSGQRKLLGKIQKDLGDFSAHLAQCKDNQLNKRLAWLEREIGGLEKKINVSKKFVSPGKNELEARLNFARVITRRAERRAISLNKQKDLPQEFLDYLNRLSWLLFLLVIDN